MTLEELIEQWRTDAESAGRLGDARGAKITLVHIAELQAALENEQDRLVTMDEAIELSGYSAQSLRRLVREGKLENHGTTGGDWLLRRGDLPKKPGEVGGAIPDMPRSDPPDADVSHSEVAGVRPMAVGSRRQIARAVVSGEQV